MVECKLIFSNTEPNVRNCIWAKPVKGGFALYMPGIKAPLKVVDDNGTEDAEDDVVQNLVGSVQDKKSANTINGAKAYARELKKDIVGKTSDTATDLTLNGLKAYIDKKIKELK